MSDSEQPDEQQLPDDASTMTRRETMAAGLALSPLFLGGSNDDLGIFDTHWIADDGEKLQIDPEVIDFMEGLTVEETEEGVAISLTGDSELSQWSETDGTLEGPEIVANQSQADSYSGGSGTFDTLRTDEQTIGDSIPKNVYRDSDKTLYVDPDNGSDSNDGSSGSPLATIQKAVDIAGAISSGRVTIDLTTEPSLPVTYSENVLLPPSLHAARDTSSPRTSRTLDIVGDPTTPSNVQVESMLVYGSGFSSPSIKGVQFTGSTPYTDDGFALQFVGGGSAVANDLSFTSGVTNGIGCYDGIADIDTVDASNCSKAFVSKRYGKMNIRNASGTASGAAYETRVMGEIHAQGALASGSPQFNAVEGGRVFDRVNGDIIYDSDQNHEFGQTHVLPNTTTPGSGGAPILRIGNGSNGQVAGFYVDSAGNIVAQNEDGTTTTL